MRFEEPEANVCGNRVLEPEVGEDCDGTATEYGPDARCGPPEDAVTACRLTCDRQDEVDRCPAGWGCGTDGVCRKPNGKLELGPLNGAARGLGDLDGDGRNDVVLRGLTGDIQVAFFTEGRVLADVYVDPARRLLRDDPALQPIVARLTEDGIDDLALPIIGDDLSVRVFTGSANRQLGDPFVELVTTPFGSISNLVLETAFNPSGVPESLCAIGGCDQTLMLAKVSTAETRIAILDDRQIIQLFRLADGYRPRNFDLARWDGDRSCDVIAVGYRYTEDGSPANLIEFFPLCSGPGQLNQSEMLAPLGTVAPSASVSLSSAPPGKSLELAGHGDVNGDGLPDLLINVGDDDSLTIDDPLTYIAYGRGDGHFDSRPDLGGTLDVADIDTPLILAHSWAIDVDPTHRIENATWPRAMADINADGHLDFALTAGIVAVSTQDPSDQCIVDGELVMEGPPVGANDEPEWGYVCVLTSDNGLVDAASADVTQAVRNWRRQGSSVTALELRSDGLIGFAAIDKNQVAVTGQPIDHSPKDYLDLIWSDPITGQLVQRTLEAVRFDQVSAGDLDGDFEIDLVYSGGNSRTGHELYVIWGPPFDAARATELSPTGFDTLRVFAEGLPSVSLGAEREGRLTVFRDGQWPALALTQPDTCSAPQKCHLRFASGPITDPEHADHFAWGLGLVDTTDPDDGGGLRPLRAATGEADFGPAYDSVNAGLVSLAEIGVFTRPERASVFAVELGTPDTEGALSGTAEAVVAARTEGQGGLVITVLRPHISGTPTGPVCSSDFRVTGPTGLEESRVLCFEKTFHFEHDVEARAFPGSLDPFIEIADADSDGDLDLTWVTVDDRVIVLPGDGVGGLDPEQLIELELPIAMPIPTGGEEPDEDEFFGPTRIDWVRWLELDGTGGKELISGDLLNGELLWGFNVLFEDRVIDPRGALELDGLDGRSIGYVGDIDGDGIDDIAVGSHVLFGSTDND